MNDFQSKIYKKSGKYLVYSQQSVNSFNLYLFLFLMKSCYTLIYCFSYKYA